MNHDLNQPNPTQCACLPKKRGFIQYSTHEDFDLKWKEYLGSGNRREC